MISFLSIKVALVSKSILRTKSFCVHVGRIETFFALLEVTAKLSHERYPFVAP